MKAGRNCFCCRPATRRHCAEAAARLAAHLASAAGSAQSLADIAHTLQSGRDAMRVRLACVVHDKADLRARLEAFAESRAEGVLTGTVERKARGASYPGDANDLAGPRSSLGLGWRGRLGDDCIRDADHRVALPTYPFQRKRFWLPETTSAPTASLLAAKVEDAVGFGGDRAGPFPVSTCSRTPSSCVITWLKARRRCRAWSIWS